MTALSTLITECRNELIDTGGSPRWTNAEFIEYANGFFRELARLAPDELSTTVTLSLAAGSMQTLPDAYDALVDIVTNAGGAPVREIDYRALKAYSAYPTTEADADGPYEFARVTGGQFAVYPAVPGGGASVTAIVVDPPVVTTVNDQIAIGDALLPAMVQYMLYRARMKDAEDTVMASRAAAAYQQFRALIGGGTSESDAA